MFETSITTLARVSGERPCIAVLCSTGGKDADVWANNNLDVQSVTVLWRTCWRRISICGHSGPIAGAVFLDAEAFHNSDYDVLLESLKPAAYSAGVSPNALVYIAYPEDDEALYQRVQKELTAIGLDSYIQPDTGEGIYFRYDTDDTTTQENGDKFNEINEDLRSVGYEIQNPQIEHDCISGNLTLIHERPDVASFNLPAPETACSKRALYFSESVHLHVDHDGSQPPSDPYGLPVEILGEDAISGFYRFQFVGYTGIYQHVTGVFVKDTESNKQSMQAYRQAHRALHDHEAMTEVLRQDVEKHLSNITRLET